jgi:uncharacterized protein YegP (UPF0339 family)
MEKIVDTFIYKDANGNHQLVFECENGKTFESQYFSSSHGIVFEIKESIKQTTINNLLKPEA